MGFFVDEQNPIFLLHINAENQPVISTAMSTIGGIMTAPKLGRIAGKSPISSHTFIEVMGTWR